MRIRDLARDAVSDITIHGASKRELGELNAYAVRSVGTERAYRNVCAAYLRWLRENRLPLDQVHTRGMMMEFLDEYAELHSRKSVDQAVQALQKVWKVVLPKVESCLSPEFRGRAYSFADLQKVTDRQSSRHQLSSLACFDAGVRAHECITLRLPRGEAASPHREWPSERFAGRTNYEVYLVTGKGGLVREVAIAREIADEIQKRERQEPMIVRDREIEYTSYFDIGGGQALSSSFSYASKRALGYSSGVHGLRHSFAQNRLSMLIPILGPKRALEILAVELGHFRASISLAYLVGN
jgi:integrase